MFCEVFDGDSVDNHSPAPCSAVANSARISGCRLRTLIRIGHSGNDVIC